MNIHMDIERVAELSEKIKELSAFSYQSTDELKTQANQTDWTGLSANDFFRQQLATCGKIHALAEQLAVMYKDVRREKDQWVEVDQQGVNRLKRVVDVPKPRENPTLGVIIDVYTDRYENHRYNEKYEEFVDWWQNRTIEERTLYLQGLQERLADRYGMPRTLVTIYDLPDGVGGQSSGGVVYLDNDHLINADPWRVIETLFHETRHEYQREVVANYQNNGLIPDGINQNQVEKWIYEFENYIGGEDSFKDYYNQAIERDARNFGDDVMKDFLSEMGQGGSGGGW